MIRLAIPEFQLQIHTLGDIDLYYSLYNSWSMAEILIWKLLSDNSEVIPDCSRKHVLSLRLKNTVTGTIVLPDNNYRLKLLDWQVKYIYFHARLIFSFSIYN
ncbi:hypothetical protein Aazo_2942 ['Nostoc azollae' 0708]|uniref:Uncharacterized protein n=1 Tax=Nostoc azollae (strain 0708) TaxID=551115 RepID=D7E181_NOSA0|nr:hypothetical protein Aazo_2942 ['Nostoc azollae' 0708]